MTEPAKKKKTEPTAEARPKRSASARAGAGSGAGSAKTGSGKTAKAKAGAKGAPSKAATKAVTKKPAGKKPAEKKAAAAKTPLKKKPAAKTTAPKARGRRLAANPVGTEANRRHKGREQGDLSAREKTARRKKSAGGRPPKKNKPVFSAVDVCLALGIALLAALGIRLQMQYVDFLQMRAVVDQQTFYEGTTVEGVDVSGMTLANALDYWRDRVEDRYGNRTATLDNGSTVTARELGYASDYEAVLSAAWSAGRNGSLERRYRMASNRRDNPVAYTVTRIDYTDAAVEDYVNRVALQVDEPAVDASVETFDAENYAFTFAEAQTGRKLDTEALKRSIEQAISAGGGNVALEIREIPPAITTEQVSESYGLIDYAITNANSSSGPRINNIKLAMSMLNGYRLAPGETFSFNDAVGERTAARGFKKATAYSGGDVTEQIGGGICQVSTTLFNAAVKADMEIVERHSHSLTVGYVDRGKDATVDWGHQDLRFRNTSADDVFICCYLTNDKRVRFGIFGRLLPNGEKITVDTVTTEVIKYETEYQPSPLLPHGATQVLQPGRNGYKAEAYKVRWDAEGNRLSRELLCKSEYKMKNEIIQYGA